MSSLNIQLGHIARHTPPNAGAQGREAAIVDIAQDLLLRELHQLGILNEFAFKGGTALRKLYVGTAGRFSLDLDFSCAHLESDPDDVLTDLIAAIDGRRIGPFGYGVSERRGTWILNYQHPCGDAVSLSSKLDLSPPPWLPPIWKGWQSLPVHSQYGSPPLPELQVVRLEENLAEKIARLNRTTTARDMYDLRWVAANPNRVGHLDQALIRRLAVLKIWVDANGLHGGQIFWKPGHQGPAFDPGYWLRDRSGGDFDIEDIGALSVPTPTAAELSEAVQANYAFLANLHPEEQVIARAKEEDRALALRLLADIPGGRLDGIGLY
jgi:predicted nucleotidyltransferase component of viral defense system